MSRRPSAPLLLLTILLLLCVTAAIAPAQERGVAVTRSVPATAEQRVALVVGNADYERISPLRNPINDAAAMAEALRETGFTVTLLQNANRRDMLRAITEFGQALRQGGVGLFYYAGHGVQSQGRNYLIPLKAQVQAEPDLEYEAVDAGRVLAKMEAARNRLNIVILDACRNNPFASGFRSANSGLAQVSAPTGSLVAYATAPGRVAADGDGANGLYTEQLMRHMRTPGLKLEEVFKRVRGDVVQRSGGQQTPWENTSVTGDFFFVPPAGSSPLLAGQAKPPTQSGFSLSDIRSAASQATQTQAAWDQQQAEMRTAQEQVLDFEREQAPTSLKVLAWERFLSAFAADNPFSDEDDALRATARAHIAQLKGESPPPVAAASASRVARPAPSGPARTWEATFGGKSFDEAGAIAATPGGGYILVGATAKEIVQGGSGFQDVATATLNTIQDRNLLALSIDADGKERWRHSYGGSRTEQGFAVAVRPDGGAVVAAATESKGAGGIDAWVIGLDAEGTLLWDNALGDVGKDELYDLRLTPEGNVLLVGTSNTWQGGVGSAVGVSNDVTMQATRSTGPRNLWLVLVDPKGEIVWERRHGGQYNDEGRAMAATPDGNYVIAGTTESKSRGNPDAWVLLVDAEGNLLWESTFGEDFRDEAHAVMVLPDGYLVAGFRTVVVEVQTANTGPNFDPTGASGKASGPRQLWIAALDSQGALRWEQRLGELADQGDARPVVLGRLPDGTIVAAGETKGASSSNTDLWVVGLDAAGKQRWSRTYGGKGRDWARSLLSLDNGFVIAGGTRSKGAGATDAWVLSLDAEGKLK